MRSIKLFCLCFYLLFITFSFSLTQLFAQVEECDPLNEALLNYAPKGFHFHEYRNDVGIFYDFEWKGKNIWTQPGSAAPLGNLKKLVGREFLPSFIDIF